MFVYFVSAILWWIKSCVCVTYSDGMVATLWRRTQFLGGPDVCWQNDTSTSSEASRRARYLPGRCQRSLDPPTVHLILRDGELSVSSDTNHGFSRSTTQETLTCVFYYYYYYFFYPRKNEGGKKLRKDTYYYYYCSFNYRSVILVPLVVKIPRVKKS